MSSPEPETAVRDKNYNLIAVVQDSLRNVFQLENYIRDAESRNDEELAQWFRAIQENNQKASEQGKRLLGQRLANEEL